MINLLIIAAGGAAGAVLRYLVSTGVHRLLGVGFPFGTLSVNVLGSMMMGLLYVMLVERMDVGAGWRAGLMIGLLGAFTTFSSFSIETLNLLEAGEQIRALLNVVLSFSFCIIVCWLGMVIGREL